jgi:probable HAF family extracellular repeat protein
MSLHLTPANPARWAVRLSAVLLTGALLAGARPVSPSRSSNSEPAGSGAPAYQITDLGTLGGAESEAYGLNNRGQVVGWSDTGRLTTGGYPTGHAFLWSRAAGMKDLTPALDGDSYATAINNRDQVAACLPVDARGTSSPVTHSGSEGTAPTHSKPRRAGTPKGLQGIIPHGSRIVEITGPLSGTGFTPCDGDGRLTI